MTDVPPNTLWPEWTAAAIRARGEAEKGEREQMGNRFFDYADAECPTCGATPAIMWRPGGAFQQRTECICGRVTRWVLCGHDARAHPSDEDVPIMEDSDD